MAIDKGGQEQLAAAIDHRCVRRIDDGRDRLNDAVIDEQRDEFFFTVQASVLPWGIQASRLFSTEILLFLIAITSITIPAIAITYCTIA